MTQSLVLTDIRGRPAVGLLLCAGGAGVLRGSGNAVFLPDFRASSGYGLHYMRAARGDVGNGRVLANIIEGLDAVIASDIGDEKRQATIGHSFGGYASLLALSHDTARFRLAFAAAPPTDYGWMKQWQATEGSNAQNSEGPPLALSFRQHGFPFENPQWLEKMHRESPMAAIGHRARHRGLAVSHRSRFASALRQRTDAPVAAALSVLRKELADR